MSLYSSFLEKTFLFIGICADDVEQLIKNASIEEKSFSRGEVIYSPDDFEKKIGFVYSGECVVSRESQGTIVPLNSVTEFDSFGIVAVFSERNEFPTIVKAKTNCTVLFFTADDILRLIDLDSRISLNVIRFLTDKINFLNDKVAAFSAGSVEGKLASYILGLSKKHGALEFEFNKKKSSEALNCGRASLYRAIGALEAGNFISFENKKIYIQDPEGLERIKK